MNRVRVLSTGLAERRVHALRHRLHLVRVDGGLTSHGARVFRGSMTGAPPEDQQVRQRVAAQAVGAVQPAADSPAANRPGTVVAAVSASTRSPPIW